MGTSLFIRTTRQVSLTDAGRQLHEQCQPYLAGLREALYQLGNPATELHGVLRVSGECESCEPIGGAGISEICAAASTASR